MPTSPTRSSDDSMGPASASPVIRMGLVGLGGYARGLIGVIRSAMPGIELAAGCDPDLRENVDSAAELRDAGGAVYPSIDTMLNAHTTGRTPLDAAWLPVPIHLHRPFTEKCLAAGLAVMVEKPAAGCLEDVDAMIASRDRSGLPVLVGFQDLYFAENHAAKRRLLDGAIGSVRRVAIQAYWPRSDAYYSRNNWAGALQRHGVWVRDSPINNALAHPVHLALFMLGRKPDAIAQIDTLEAELYRANPIESFDTCTLRMRTDTGVEMTICFTHASATQSGPVTTYHGEAGTLTASHRELTWSGDHIEPKTVCIFRDMANLPRRFAAAVRGHEADQLPAATLDTARVHTALVERLHDQTTIHTIPENAIHILAHDAQRTRTVPGLEAALDACAQEGCLLSELPTSIGRFEWARTATH